MKKETIKGLLLKKDFSNIQNIKNLFDFAYNEEDIELAKQGRDLSVKMARVFVEDVEKSKEFYEYYRKFLLFLSRYDFDSFCIYIELDREPEKRFYQPRRKQLLPLVKSLQDLADDKLDILAISLPPGVGKTTLALFFIVWLGGKSPEKPILTGSHSTSFLRGTYEECLRLLDKDGEYLVCDVFPDVDIANTNAQDLNIDLGERKRFATLQFTSIGSGNAGKVRAETLLYCDDLISSIEEAMSKTRLNKLWEQYTTDLRQRKIGGCKELHIATRWSVHDIIGRLQKQYEGNDRVKFISVPALNDKDESNFNYPIEAGFTTEFYHDMRNTMDDVSWRCLYMNEPIEREGVLFPEQQLKRYFELPNGEPDAIISICDTKDKGPDYCVMPVAYVYGDEYYIEDVICDNSAPDVFKPRLVGLLLTHNVQMSRFEHNVGGGIIAQEIQESVRKRGGTTKITTKYTTGNKETKIIVNSAWIIEHCLFKDKTMYAPKSDYGVFMRMLCDYNLSGRNKHDDAPDAMAMLAEYSYSAFRTKAVVFERFF